MDSTRLDDESLPTFLRRDECIRLLDLAISEYKRRGKEMVDAEMDYYATKAEEALAMLDAGYSNTFISAVIKGRPEVCKAMGRFHEAEVLWKNAEHAINAYKLKLRSLENDIAREYEQCSRQL